MDSLPVEVITYIFNFLPSLKDRKAASLVCWLWYEAYQYPSFRNHETLHITSDNQFQTLANLKNLERKYHHLVVKEIEIRENSFQFWERYGPNIKTLAICSCDIREKIFVKILRKCSHLEALTVQSCRELFMVGHLFEDEDERLEIREKLKTVNSLNLSYNRYLSDAVFVKFTLVFPKIKKLLLSGCQISFFQGLYKKYYPNGQVAPSKSVLTFPVILSFLQTNADELKHLFLNDTYIDNSALSYISRIEGLHLNSLHLRGCFQLSHDGIVHLSSLQRSLTELDVSLCPRITDGCLLKICSGLHNLTSLSIQKCRGITDLGVSGLCELKNLIYLNISECDLIEGEGLVKGLCFRINPKFKELRLSHLGNMTDNVVVSLSKCLPNLKVLDLGYCYNAVTNRSVQSILQHNKYLQTLILTMCERLSDSGLTGVKLKMIPTKKIMNEGFKLPLGSKAELEIVREAKLKLELQEICENCSNVSGFSLKNLKGLQHLNLTGCNGISDVSLTYAFEFQELRSLNLSHCNQISKEGLQHLSTNCRSIEFLNLEHCQNVDNEGVYHIVKNFKRLDTLILGSNKITDSVALYITQYSKQLIYLDIRNCYQITSDGVNEIMKSLPNLQNFYFSSSKLEDAQIPVPPSSIGLELFNKNIFN